MDDKTFAKAMRARPPNTVIIMEDVDCLFDSRKHSDMFSTSVTFSGLLNVIDGVSQYKNLIMVFTTNHIEVLDDALKRRVDYFLKMEYMTKDQMNSIYNRFFPEQSDTFEEFFGEISHLKMTPNIIQKFFTRHLNDKIINYVNELSLFAQSELKISEINGLYS
tara:strand:- start:373 stop:861 length:489 start_codon:yes stop_codon:yes gene_type:complete